MLFRKKPSNPALFFADESQLDLAYKSKLFRSSEEKEQALSDDKSKSASEAEAALRTE